MTPARTTPFAIGESIWWPAFDTLDSYIDCPDCGGTCVYRITLWDGTEHNLPCQTCLSGFLGPMGRILSPVPVAKARTGIVSGMTITQAGSKYQVGDGRSHWLIADQDAFTSQEEALAACPPLLAAYHADNQRRIAAKVKNHKSWAWHVSYHRREISRLREKIEQHAQQLGIARCKVKDAPDA
jgi:hypothetical protein